MPVLAVVASAICLSHPDASERLVTAIAAVSCQKLSSRFQEEFWKLRRTPTAEIELAFAELDSQYPAKGGKEPRDKFLMLAVSELYLCLVFDRDAWGVRREFLEAPTSMLPSQYILVPGEHWPWAVTQASVWVLDTARIKDGPVRQASYLALFRRYADAPRRIWGPEPTVGISRDVPSRAATAPGI
jgi:hypothetical protein